MLLALLFSSLLQPAHAADLSMTIVDVRRNITLANDEEPYKDFYIAADGSSGLKKNLVVTAVRKINIRDASGANAVGDITVPVGQLKIIAVYDKIAVAREFTLLSRDELPMLEQIGIMTGDRIDMRGSFIDTSKPKKKKVAEAEAVPATSTTTVAVTVTAPPQTAPVTPAVPAPAAQAAPVAAAPALATEGAPKKDLQASEPKTVAMTSPEKALEKVADSGNTSGHE